MKKDQISGSVSPAETRFSSESLIGLRVAVYCGLALVIGGGMFMASRMSHAFLLSDASSEATVRTAAGDWRVERPNEIGPGLPVYPDSLLVLPGHGSTPAGLKNGQAAVHSSTYYSTDSSGAVDDWYMKHLGPEFTRSNSAGDEEIASILSNAKIAENHTIFIGERGDQVSIVSIATDSTGTRITLVRSVKHATP